MTEPRFYGKAGYVNEGPKPEIRLDDLSHEELDLMRSTAFHRRDASLERAASFAMKKRYFELIRDWFYEVEHRTLGLEDKRYLDGFTEIIRLGLNDHRKELYVFWPQIKQRANMLSFSMRATPNASARKRYQAYSRLVDLVSCK